MLKLIDSNILFNKKRIVADSDIIFMKKPDEIIDWLRIKKPTQSFYHEVNEANKLFANKINFINSQLGTNIQKLDYCSGLIGFNKSIPIDEIEKTFKCLSSISNVWGLEQNIFAFLLKEKSMKLPPQHYLAIIKETASDILREAKMIHFVGKFKHKQYLNCGNLVISELGNL
ncbi:MAG: hypothetical protein CTY23_03420 [Methylomonas sp.]|nr:MAG: hypothetical protein CTY23_03420 [Methylomonas sp.]